MHFKFIISFAVLACVSLSCDAFPGLYGPNQYISEGNWETTGSEWDSGNWDASMVGESPLGLSEANVEQLVEAQLGADEIGSPYLSGTQTINLALDEELEGDRTLVPNPPPCTPQIHPQGRIVVKNLTPATSHAGSRRVIEHRSNRIIINPRTTRLSLPAGTVHVEPKLISVPSKITSCPRLISQPSATEQVSPIIGRVIKRIEEPQQTIYVQKSTPLRSCNCSPRLRALRSHTCSRVL